MQYALVDGQRQEPSPGAKGECEMCGAPPGERRRTGGRVTLDDGL